MSPGDWVVHVATPEVIGIVLRTAGTRILVRWSLHTATWSPRRALQPCPPTVHKFDNRKNLADSPALDKQVKAAITISRNPIELCKSGVEANARLTVPGEARLKTINERED